jgi:uncharacterized protein YdeI (BOF family)
MNTQFAVLTLSLLATACGRAAAPPSDSPSGGASAATAQETSVAAARVQAGEPQLTTFSGTILETMDAAGYTYMKLKTANGEEWTAVSQAVVKTGDTVTVSDGLLMQGFESRTLERKFDRIYFGRLASAAETAAGGAMPAAGPATSFPPEMLAALAAQHSGAATAAAPKGDVKVPKAEGPDGRTIAEVYAGKAALQDRRVVVRGTVVKFNPAIMGRNWVHIRDGSGAPETKDNDLTLTTQDTVAIGDVVLARGTLRLDKDFGAGYTYPVILEDVKIGR